MNDLYVKNSFCDLNVVIQEGKKANNDMLQMLGDCEQRTACMICYKAYSLYRWV